ncbi:LysE family translocator [Corynebacterium pseudotuberculosis]|uniref:LysE family transporter n=1 Tax=Corynebacterium pseudotuberculosis (strain C231) TaxID=681645 RepID=D9QBV7_CORP2|nr:LysE family translocator [Corynebacterium pseudotuberculosis]ADK29369.1 LysE family transporter [Corynebacterium pseudotuberculosis FRC41]ADL11033.1 LysE family transporter [Corynebacterium pseudotuberculosis C231]ADL21438.1 LysE family translocator [Corynebacterium pseudotuberculosis 1002]ADO26833.1 LysE family transporter [Corynebacterium pseudotuberculosis I19]AEK92898.1 LysE type translocator [Corynebacterium pseudotuberculosis PAT10]
MELNQLGTLVLISLVGMVTPGPDIFFVTRLATKSRRHAYAAVCGITIGVTIWLTLTVFGATALLTAYPAILSTIQLVGGLWILWMGIQLLLSSRAQLRDGGVTVATNLDALVGTPRSCLRQGLFTNLSNPKIILYLAAIIAPFLPSAPSIGTALLVIVTLVTCTFGGFMLLATLISTNAMRVKLLKAGPWIDLGAGLFFIFAGCGLVFAGVTSFF